MIYKMELDTPAALLRICMTDEAILYVGFAPPDERWLARWFPDESAAPPDKPLPPPAKALETQIREYFQGQRKQFDLPLDVRDTDFRRRVYGALREIPYGQTVSYGELARRLGSAPRAVGQANHNNPISIVIPCHRVIGADGSMVGYGGGLPRKTFLLELEARITHGD